MFGGCLSIRTTCGGHIIVAVLRDYRICWGRRANQIKDLCGLEKTYGKSYVSTWGTSAYKEKCQQAKRNRAADPERCVHTGGCISTGTHAQKLVTKIQLFYNMLYYFVIHLFSHCYRLMLGAENPQLMRFFVTST